MPTWPQVLHGLEYAVLPEATMALTNAIKVTAAVSRQLLPKEFHPGNGRNLAITTDRRPHRHSRRDCVPRCRRHCRVHDALRRRAHQSSGFAVERNIQRARAFWAISIGAGRDCVGRVGGGCCQGPAQSDLGEPPVRAVPAARSERDPYS